MKPAVTGVTNAKSACIVIALCIQNRCLEGEALAGSLVEAPNGDFYGTTPLGGITGHGTVFKVSRTGVHTPLHEFCSHIDCADGSLPSAELALAADGDFYGATAAGGAACPPHGSGTFFKITPSGILTTIYRYGGADGGLTQATDSYLYGTTASDGANGRGRFLGSLPLAR
ncbi:MAG TPA: choice-of-anchor tandem repeat GloVer-containing protein [Bryobacteraceae bacterium]|jgi:uncharacterized repeat protein (TIGR03803 family)|nr:choice-of-anchor tandem repeat GloVer-containing protein [Bryobacteraceae bacterium]